jgi:hypothetical protein
LVIVLKGERMKEEEEEEIHHFSLKIGSPFFREVGLMKNLYYYTLSFST